MKAVSIIAGYKPLTALDNEGGVDEGVWFDWLDAHEVRPTYIAV